MELGLAGRTALVTGASKGIGRAIAEGLAAEGVNLHLVARTKADLDAAGEAIRARWNVNVMTHAADLSKGDTCRAVAEGAGDLDILINNAGAIPGGDILAVDEDRWREAWDLKVYGFINLARAVYPGMKARGGGVIINIIGLGGEMMDGGYIAGAAGNASLMAFSRALGSKTFDQKVRVVGINPGMVATDRMRALLQTKAEKEHGDPSRWQDYVKHLPQGRAAEPREIADAAVFLASDRASYISGTVLTIDGGTLHRRG